MEKTYDYEKMRSLIRKLCEMISQRISAEIPESGKFTPIGVTFSIPGTDNVGLFEYKDMMTQDRTERMLFLACFRRGSFYKTSTPIFNGTNSETIEFLKFTDEDIEKYMKIFLDFSEGTDDRCAGRD